MNDIIVKSNDVVREIYILGQHTACHAERSEASVKYRSFADAQDDKKNAQDYSLRIVVERGGRVDVVVLIMPGVSEDLKFNVELVGEGAEANIYGAYVCGADERVKIAVDMYHKVPHCNSRQLFKGVAGGSSRVDFYGKIIVAQDAQRTEAYQENHNILLSDNAKVDTKPQLEIYADDVKCSHGATIGRLNEEEQFYMRSRGITLEDAKVLQMISFIAPVLENIPEADREKLSAQFEDSIRSIVHTVILSEAKDLKTRI